MVVIGQSLWYVRYLRYDPQLFLFDLFYLVYNFVNNNFQKLAEESDEDIVMSISRLFGDPCQCDCCQGIARLIMCGYDYYRIRDCFWTCHCHCLHCQKEEDFQYHFYNGSTTVEYTIPWTPLFD